MFDQKILKSYRNYIFITSCLIYFVGILFLVFGIYESKHDSKRNTFIDKTNSNNWLIEQNMYYVHWAIIYSLNMFMGGANLCYFLINWIKFNDILWMFIYNIICCSFLVGLYSVFFTWYVILFFAVFYITNCVFIYKAINILYKINNSENIAEQFNIINTRDIVAPIYAIGQMIGLNSAESSNGEPLNDEPLNDESLNDESLNDNSSNDNSSNDNSSNNIIIGTPITNV